MGLLGARGTPPETAARTRAAASVRCGAVETETVPIQYRVTLDAAMAARCGRAHGR
jgi:hypothetical protein